MFCHNLFPKDILEYINRHPAFDLHGAVIDSKIYYDTAFNKLIQCILNRRDREAIAIIKSLGNSQEDFKNSEYFFVAGWLPAFFTKYNLDHITMENTTSFLKIVESFYLEYYSKPSGYILNEPQIILQDDDELLTI